MDQDTIAAIATAPGEAGIAVIRVSGPTSLAIADSLFVGSSPPPSRRPPFSAVHGRIKGQTEVLDEVILLIMRAPHSYTREDVVEIQCHGGNIQVRRILQATLNAGARLADPGEFTQRAFLNGRIDLLQAEAVLDLIRARSDRAASSALEQLEGKLSRLFTIIYNDLLDANADLEATLDFSEDDLPPVVIPDVIKKLITLQGQLAALLETWEEGHLLREGALVVISGKPNVGKSTLLNLLLGKERAIVSATPGTTRDIIEETLILNGIPIRLVDTAGLRTTDCDIENEGVRRARLQMRQADIHLHVMDLSQVFDAEDYGNLLELNSQRSIVVLNKSDLHKQLQLIDYQSFNTIQTCLISGIGLTDIKQAIACKLGSISSQPAHAVISERHRQMIISTQQEIEESLNSLQTKQEDMIVMAAANIRMAAISLGEIIGKQYNSELLKAIFSKFCVGK